MLSARILTAILGAPLLLGAAWLGGWPLRVLLALIGGLAARELARLLLREHKQAGVLLPLAVVALILLTRAPQTPQLPIAWGAVGLLLGLIVQAPRLIGRRRAEATTGLPLFIFGLIYIGVGLAHILMLRGLPDGLVWTAFLFVVTWASDTGAYAAGRTLGRHPLSPAISPNKSVEGAIGGLILAGAAGYAFAYWGYWPAHDAYLAPVIAVALSCVVQLGDLFESALKREAGVKDAGTLLPGHGGVLDRFDGLLWSAPAAYYVIALVHGG